MTKRMIKSKRQMRKVLSLVKEATHSIALTPAAGALTGGTVGVAHAGVTFASSTAEGDTGFRVSAGALPAGMALNSSTGVLSGTPTAAGANSFSITVTDGVGNSQTNAYTLAIA